MRIAFFGGSFDPPHRGHLAVARAAIRRMSLDLVLFAPVGQQPLKRGAQSSSFADRVRMVELAIEGADAMALSLADQPRNDGGPNYTIDALLEIKRLLTAEDALFCLLGADSFLTVRQWHRAAELLFLCDIIVAGRPGFSLDELTTALPQGMSAIRKSGNQPAGVAAWDLIAGGQSSSLYLIPDLQEDISATEIRAARSGERTANELLAPRVVEYIEEKNLYREN